MTNPVTHQLIGQIADRKLTRFVEHWDALEALVIRVYKGKIASPADEKAYRQNRNWLNRKYSRYQDALTPYWQATRINDEPVTGDPFRALIAPAQAADFVDNWPAMQTLPAARQALNEWLVDKVHSG